MSDCSGMNVTDLLAAAQGHLETERDLESVLIQAAELAEENNPALAMLLRVLAAEPSEIGAVRAEEMLNLATRLHPDSDGPALCRVAGAALAQFADD